MLPELQSTIVPANFHAIRSLEISVIHPLVKKEPQSLDEEWFSWWEDAWDVIKGMRGLVYIQVWIKMYQVLEEDFVTAEQEAKLFAPLMGLDWLRGFKVEVSWPPTEGSQSLLHGAPFDLDRNSDPIPGKPVWPTWQKTTARFRSSGWNRAIENAQT